MLFFSGCKINLGLRIIRKRNDGYHDIETIFYSVPWNDVIEYQIAGKTSIEVMGRKVDGDEKDNLVLKAYNLLKEKHDLPPLQFMLLKNVPMGAGLGGGSANAAAVLKKLNEDFNLKISENDLVELVATVGSDSSFFIHNKPCIATGRGETLKPIDIDLKNYWLLILYPNVNINTSWAYKTFASANKYSTETITLTDIIHQPVSQWKNSLMNDFERIVFEEYSVLKNVKERLYNVGATYASLSGSGSAIFGLFHEKPDAEKPINKNSNKCMRLIMTVFNLIQYGKLRRMLLKALIRC